MGLNPELPSGVMCPGFGAMLFLPKRGGLKPEPFQLLGGTGTHRNCPVLAADHVQHSAGKVQPPASLFPQT